MNLVFKNYYYATPWTLLNCKVLFYTIKKHHRSDALLDSVAAAYTAILKP